MAIVKWSNNKRIGVIHLIHTMAYGGVETAVINWVKNIDRSKFDVYIVCFANQGNTEAPFVNAAEREGLHVLKIPWSRRKPLLKAARELARIVREHQIDIIHSHNWYADFVCVITALFTHVKTVTTIYVWSDYDWKRNLLQAIDKRVIRFFDQITAHCSDTLKKTIQIGIPEKRIKTLICGFESKRVNISDNERLYRRRNMGIKDDQILLANIARLYPEKAQDMLLECFKNILKQAPHARLWIVGVGPLENRLKTLSNQLGLDNSVSFLGFVQDLPNLLALVDIQVHPSIIEGVPLAICQGMAAGLPIVATSVGGLPELLQEDGTNGILIAPGDRPGFEEAVFKLIKSPDKRRQLGLQARKFIENDYSLSTAVKRVEHTYYDMLGLCVSVFS